MVENMGSKNLVLCNRCCAWFTRALPHISHVACVVAIRIGRVLHFMMKAELFG